MKRVRSIRLLCSIAGLVLAAPGIAWAQFEVVPLAENGPRGEQVNVVFLAEGYRASESAMFVAKAQAVYDEMLSEEPYRSYGTYVNAYAVPVASAESGSDHPSRSHFRDTYFDTYYDCSNIARLICIGDQAAVFDVLATTVPEFDTVVLIVNDPEYGGSGGFFSTTSNDPDAARIVIHEIGHSFAGLGDEYGGSTPLAGRETPNTTQSTGFGGIVWRHWIDASTPLPTPANNAFNTTVGLFEGAAYSDTGWYRPQRFCMMRTLDRAFCAVCREKHVQAIYTGLSPIRTVEPEARDQVAQAGEVLRYSATVREPLHGLDVAWYVDGEPIAEEHLDGPHTLALPVALLAPGVHEVSVRVADRTPFVRDQTLLPLLDDAATWSVTVSGSVGIETPAALDLVIGQPYPNPASAGATVRVPVGTQAPGSATTQFFDLTGRALAPPVQHSYEGALTLALPPLGAGVYLLRVRRGPAHVWRHVVVLP